MIFSHIICLDFLPSADSPDRVPQHVQGQAGENRGRPSRRPEGTSGSVRKGSHISQGRVDREGGTRHRGADEGGNQGMVPPRQVSAYRLVIVGTLD